MYCTVLLEYFTVLTNFNAIFKCIVAVNSVFHRDSALVHRAFDTVQLLQCKT